MFRCQEGDSAHRPQRVQRNFAEEDAELVEQELDALRQEEQGIVCYAEDELWDEGRARCGG